MDGKKKAQLESVFEKLKPESYRYIKSYFQTAPDWLLEESVVKEYDKNECFIEAGQDIEYVYVLLRGIVKATDYRIEGAMYHIMWFQPVQVFGSLEIFLKEKKFKASLMTITPCTMLLIPMNSYQKWIKKDLHALYMESSATTKYLIEQSMRDRVYLFMQGNDRLAFFLLHYYEQFQKNGVCKILLTRQELSDCTGLSLKTVNRAILNLISMSCIGKEGSKILINEEQKEQLQTYIGTLVAQ